MAVHAFDIDGTLSTNTKIHECLKKEYPAYERHMLVDYNLGNSLLLAGVISSKSEYSNADFFDKYTNEIYGEAEIYEYVADYIKQLLKDGHKIIIITARPPSAEDITQSWLNKNGLSGIPVFYTNHQSKLPILTEYKANFFYEDKLETVLEVAKSPYLEKIYVPNHTYNQGDLPDNCERINDWSKFSNAIEVH